MHLHWVVLLMEEILHHPGGEKTLCINGIGCLSTGAGFWPSTVSFQILRAFEMKSFRISHLELEDP